MYNVLDVCRYIVNYSDDKEYSMSNLKLQKILYFVQAYFLAFTSKGEPCFKEKIEAWDFGPVVPEAYHEFKQYGSNDIPRINTVFILNPENFWQSKILPYDDSIISENDKSIINKVVDKFSNYSATALVSITHNQAPWKKAYKIGKNTEISIESIKEYYREQ